jgi:hypothetical protein
MLFYGYVTVDDDGDQDGMTYVYIGHVTGAVQDMPVSDPWMPEAECTGRHAQLTTGGWADLSCGRGQFVCPE